MKILVAPDSFKESLSAIQATQAIQAGILAAIPTAQLTGNTSLNNDGDKSAVATQAHGIPTIQVHGIPMADGGEGTIECLAYSVPSCQVMQAHTQNAMGQSIEANWGLLEKQTTAIIEMASAAGLQQIPPEQRDIFQASTYGVGLLIRQALDYPIQRLVLTLGGSATNDAGLGMLQALGVRFLDEQQQAIAASTPAYMAQIHTIDISGLDPRLHELEIIVAADVRNPLYGPNGASYIFAPQKGAKPEQVEMLDSALRHFAAKVRPLFQHDYAQQPGAGAAGGLGFAALSFLQAKFVSGVSLLAEYTQLEQHIANADLVITGEGSLDAQTLQGKALAGIAQICLRHSKPLIAFAGRLQEGYQDLYAQGLTAAFSINPGGISPEQAMQDGAELLRQTSRNVMQVYRL